MIEHGSKSEHRGLRPNIAARCTGEILVALEFLHSNGVVFRDCKPENVVLKQNRCLITDFGRV